MKAMMLTDYRRLEIVDVPRPQVGANEVLVRVAACGICGSDIHGFDGTSGRRIPPLVMGHEAAGTVAEVGDQVTRIRPGMRVAFDSMVSCGSCPFCRAGQLHLCDRREVLGVSCEDYRRHGAFAEYVSVPQHIVYPMPDGLLLEHAAMLEAASVAVHAAGRSDVALGDTAVVVGSGMIGLLIVQALRLAGCAPIIAVDLDDSRLKLATRLGADHVLNPGRCDAIAEVMCLTAGRGADVAIEAVGASEPIEIAIRAVRKGGTVTLVGNVTPTISLPLQTVVTRELKLAGSCASNGEFATCIELVAGGKICVEPLISAAVPLEEGPSWFERLHAGQSGLMKVILKP